jgi:hypothetical protein
MNVITERRNRRRIRVHWPIQLLLRSARRAISSTTLNVSSDGFYCLCPEAFERGEVIRCLIAIPCCGSGNLRLHCRIRVVRVERDHANGGYGMGCQILQFSVTRGI